MTMAGAAYRASHKATIAVMVDLPHCLQHSTSVLRDVVVSSCDWIASGSMPQSLAKVQGSSARASCRYGLSMGAA